MKEKNSKKIKLKLIEGNPDAETKTVTDEDRPIYIKAAVMGSRRPDIAIFDYISSEEIDIKKVSQLLNLKPHVLKYWENEFVGIISNKYPDSNRTYSINDFAKIVEVKRLLYQESLSISDAQLKLSNFIVSI